jgi:tetratricopeptide (TPR) repeat protein
MKKILILITFISTVLTYSSFALPIDSLKQQLKLALTDSAKADLNTKLATSNLALVYTSVGYNKWVYQENTINYTMQALHLYSKLADTAGLINSYATLSKGYRTQKKYAQAKWFILQANTLARTKKSIPSIVSTLVDLAVVKMDVNDYKLAKRDLNEAYRWLVANRDSVQYNALKEAYTRLYTKIKVPESENIFSKDINQQPIAPPADTTVKVAVVKKPKQKKSAVALTSTAKAKVYSTSEKEAYTYSSASL